MAHQALIKAAEKARETAYTPYSGFSVGAALLTRSGKIYTGCNIENAAYTPTSCAERTAFFTAVHAGERHFTAIAVVGGKAGESPGDFCAPCGVCRQVMAEFCGSGFEIVLAKNSEMFKVYTLSQLLPQAFGPGNLKGEDTI